VLGRGFLVTGGTGAWTNLSQYNNDAGFLVTGGIGAWTNLSQYNNDAGFLAAETQTLAQVLAQGNDAGGVLLTNVPSIWGSAGMQVDLENGRLYANDVLSFDWFTGYSYGTDGTTILIDRYSSLLNDWSGIQSLHWHNRYGYNSSSNVIFRWDGPQLADASGTNYYVLNHELAIYATGTPVYVESDPVYTGASNLLAWIGSTGGWTNLSQYNNDSGFATGTPIYVESDPVYTGASNLLAWIGSTGGWTNLSQYNNDAGFLITGGIGAWTNLSQYNNDFGFGTGDVTIAMMQAYAQQSNANLTAWSAISTAVADKTNAYAVQVTDYGKTFVITNALSVNFTLPSVTVANAGLTYTFVKLSSGTLTITAADADTIADSGAGGTLSDSEAAETYATVTIRLVGETQWVLLGGHGTWTSSP
jgi:hypothetical protein